MRLYAGSVPTVNNKDAEGEAVDIVTVCSLDRSGSELKEVCWDAALHGLDRVFGSEVHEDLVRILRTCGLPGTTRFRRHEVGMDMP